MKKFLKISLWASLLLVLVVGINYALVSYRAEAYLYDNPEELEEHEVAVLLGTSRYLKGGGPNLYFSYRMAAAAELYHAGKISYILVSGDNRKKNYNEPRAMQQALVELGVPAERIILDYAGFRTLDSMVRAREVFGQDSFVVISQKFHNERAVYIARHEDIEAVGYNARDVKSYAGFRTRAREVFARMKMTLDLYIFQTEPKFLGEKEHIPAKG